ncbi:MAG: DJ-1/PfpI family protein [Gemmatimonadota bacterium]
MSPVAPQPLNVAILLFDEVEVLDFAGPFEVFSVAAGLLADDRLRVVTVAKDPDAVRAIGGLTVLPDHTLAASPAPDVLVVPGGDGSRRAMDDAVILDWVTRVHRRADLVMSVCSGARILARAGLLDGLRVTTHHQVVEHLRELAPGAEVDPGPRFIDTGRIVTTGGISAGIDGSFHVVARLFGEETAERTAAYMEYDRRPARAAAHPPSSHPHPRRP